MASKKQPTTAVAETKQNLPAEALEMDFAADAGAGLENADVQSMAIPYLLVLQALSPQLEEIDGAKAGLIIDSITNELLSEVEVVQCGYKRHYVRWGDREAGGGFKGAYSALDVERGAIEGLQRDAEGRLTIDGDQLADTREHYVLYKSASGDWHPAVISMSRTQIKRSRRWMTLVQSKEMRTADGKPFTPPSYAYIYTLTTQKEENAKGKWHSWTVTGSRQIDDAELYARARALHSQIAAGTVQAATPEPAAEQEGEQFESF